MTASPTLSLLNLVNMPDLLDRVDNDRELLQELFQLFRVEFPRLQSELQEAVSSKNMRQAVKAAHTIRGMLANLSLEGAATSMEALENTAALEDQSGTENALIAFNNQVVTLLPSLDAYLDGQGAQRSGSDL